MNTDIGMPPRKSATPTRRAFRAAAAGAFAVPATEARGQSRQNDPHTFDFIVVGGGSSGCVVASRLSEDRNVRVLLIEAGGPADDPLIRQPGVWTSLLGGRWDWAYTTRPEPHLQGRQVAWPRGKGLGGSTLINAMVYVRGHRLDFDQWERLGNPGWGFQSVLPFFLRSEDNERGPSAFHGSGGPVWVADTKDPTEAHLAFLEAARELGYDADAAWDFNGHQQENGAGFYQKTISGGRRQTAADAFIAAAAGRPNLTIRPWTHATRLLLEGRRVTGVEFVADGRPGRARAAHEVILCAGVVESPKLLLLSGIGAADALRRVGVAPHVDLPGVGENLQDHLKVTLTHRTRRDIPGSTVSAGMFLRSHPGLADAPPDLQFYFGRGLAAPMPLFAMTVALERPASRGRIALASSDPMDAPHIEPRYLESAADVTALAEGVRLLRALARTKAFAPWCGDEVDPGTPARTADDLAAFVRRAADTIFHPAGTCRMGDDRLAVVNARLQVHGLDGLRVADASIMPSVVNGNTNAACLMIGERAAAFARGGGA
jgi:choline dehydrogenase